MGTDFQSVSRHFVVVGGGGGGSASAMACSAAGILITEVIDKKTQHTRKSIRARKTTRKYNKDRIRLRYPSPGMRVNTRYINSTSDSCTCAGGVCVPCIYYYLQSVITGSVSRRVLKALYVLCTFNP